MKQFSSSFQVQCRETITYLTGLLLPLQQTASSLVGDDLQVRTEKKDGLDNLGEKWKKEFMRLALPTGSVTIFWLLCKTLGPDCLAVEEFTRDQKRFALQTTRSPSLRAESFLFRLITLFVINRFSSYSLFFTVFLSF